MTDNLTNDLRKQLLDSSENIEEAFIIDVKQLMMTLVPYIVRREHRAWDDGYRKGKGDNG